MKLLTQLISKLLAEYPDDINIRIGVASYYDDSNQLEKAIEQYEKLVKLGNEHAISRLIYIYYVYKKDFTKLERFVLSNKDKILSANKILGDIYRTKKNTT